MYCSLKSNRSSRGYVHTCKKRTKPLEARNRYLVGRTPSTRSTTRLRNLPITHTQGRSIHPVLGRRKTKLRKKVSPNLTQSNSGTRFPGSQHQHLSTQATITNRNREALPQLTGTVTKLLGAIKKRSHQYSSSKANSSKGHSFLLRKQKLMLKFH